MRNAPEAPLFESSAEIARFKSALRSDAIGREIIFQPVAESTNDLALAAARQGAAHGMDFAADEQRSGRGRRGRRWEAPPRAALLFSILLRPTALASENFGWLPLLAGWGAAAGLHRACGLKACLKWPNDIVLPQAEPPGWRKLGGILGESLLAPAGASSGRGGDYFILGIGLNINQAQADLPATNKAPATSLCRELGRSFSRLEVLRAVLEELDQLLGGLEKSAKNFPASRQGLQAQMQRWWPPEKIFQLRSGGGFGGHDPIPSGIGIVSPETGRGIGIVSPETSRGSFAELDAAGRLRLKTARGVETVPADAEIVEIIS
jgi:biotin-[acetyl-CoA-carboxylase] ligase BirA-like protein